ncbi:UTRA domain-containing protein [Neobacillus vireti]|uniref:UTRA domain-containing protein n=1 Tax=Neobacillus vireti TaxID=220686 RepID=UPI002FFFAF35
MKLNDASHNPLYYQLKQLIKEEINRGTYQPGQQLPSESHFCEKYGVSRITARRAITDLVKEGILFSLQGKGSFVKESKVKRELVSVSGFTELTTASGKTPSSQILSSTIIIPNEQLMSVFKMKPKEQLLKLHRLLSIDKQPFIIETSYYPLKHLPDLEQFIGEKTSTYKILKDKYNVDIIRSEKTLDVVTATEYEANLFQCNVSTPLYLIEKVAYDQQERPIHLSQSLFVTTKVSFTFTVETEANADSRKYE